MPEPDRVPTAGDTASSSLTAALLTVGGMVTLIIVAVALFGEGAEGGPLQAAMTLGLALSIVIAAIGGHSAERMADGIRESINSALGTIFVLLAVGALIGALFLSGTIASVVYYGARFGSPSVLYILVFVLASVLSYAIGSSFTTIAAIGLPFVALAGAMGVSPVVTAAAAVAGAAVGDALGRISDTFTLTRSVVGVEAADHARTLARVITPGWLVSAALFVVLGLRDGGADGFESGPTLEAIESQFWVSPVAMLPLVVVLVLAARTTGFLALIGGAVSAVILAGLTQGELIAVATADAGRGAFADWLAASLATLGNGFGLQSGVEALDATFTGGGVTSMLPTVWLILVAASFGAVIDLTGMLNRLLAPVLAWATGGSRLVTATAGTSIGLNTMMADPYLSIILAATTFRDRFVRARLEPHVASVSIAASGSLVSYIIPWNVHGAFVAGTLGIAVFSFAQYAVLLWLTPFVLVLYGFVRLSHDEIPADESVDEVYAGEEEPPERRTSV